MSGVEGLTGTLAAWLRERGVEAREGWSGAERAAMAVPTAVVTVRGCKAGEGAFARYLGERFDEESGAWREVYGRKLELEVGLDLYAPETAAQRELRQGLDRLLDVLTRESPGGLRVDRVDCGEPEWDRAQRRLRQEVTAVCTAWLEAAAGEDGEFLDFELRGGWKN